MNNQIIKTNSKVYLGLVFSLLLLQINSVIAQNKVSDHNDYWQQKSDYIIDVELDDKNHVLRGFEVVHYQNNSNDTLRFIYFHCWPNAYSNKNTPLAKQLLAQGNTYLQLDDNRYKGFMDSLDFKVNNNNTKWSFVDEHKEMVLIPLSSPLLPGESIEISTPFRVKIPTGVVSRLGHLDQSYQITQWYPKPAVYDKNGWHPMPYLSQGEFYSEFGDFNVNITLPNNYIVASTGDLTDDVKNSELYFLEQKMKQTNKILATYPMQKDGYIYQYPFFEDAESSTEKKTLKYYQENVHDFAWFTDKNWLVMKRDIVIPRTFKKVEGWVYFSAENIVNWRSSLDYLELGVQFYSDEIGPYPYNHVTAVDGSITAGAGMEYPKITVLGVAENKTLFEETLVHEVGHNWFYGMLASNERMFPWMDEGMNSYFELKYFEKIHPDYTIGDMIGGWADNIIGEETYYQKLYYELAYLMSVSRNEDQRVDLEAQEYTEDNYPSIIYCKSALIFRYLQGYLGEEVLREIFQKYFDEFNSKHVYPEDFWTIAERVSGKDLSWVYNDLFSTKKLDYAVQNAGVDFETKQLQVLVKNKGGVVAPLVISTFLNGELQKTYWFEGFEDSKVLNLGIVNADEVMIDYHLEMPEINRNNNFYKVYNVFGGFNPVKFFPLASIDHPKTTEVFFIPFIGYNANDNVRLGVALHNLGVKEKKFRFLSTPSYGFGSEHIVGTHKLVYSFYPDSIFNKINLFGMYRNETFPTRLNDGFIEKYEGGIRFNIKKKNPLSPFKQNIQVRYSAVKIKIPSVNVNANEYVTLTYNGDYKSTLNPFDYQLNAQVINSDLLKLWGSTHLNLTVNKRKLQHIELRLFGGLFLSELGPRDQRHRFRLTAHNGAGVQSIYNDEFNMSGMTDYLMDEVYVGRYVNNLANVMTQQISIADGGFKTGINYGATSTWLTSANLTVPTPTKYFSIFADYGLFGFGDEYRDAYTAGLQINIIKDYFEIYLPLSYSDGIENNFIINNQEKFLNQIRFLLDLKDVFNLID